MRPELIDSVDPPRIFTPEYYQRMRALEGGSWWNAGMRDVAGQLLNLAALGSTGRMLDMGCGSGQTMRWFAEGHPGWQVLGLDIAPEGVMAARMSGLSGTMQASALDLPVRASSVDLVIALDVLQHLPLDGGDRQALREVARVLKPNGHLLIRTNAQTFPQTADDPEFQFHKYETRELRSKMEEAGLSVLRLGRLNALLGLAEIPRELRARAVDHTHSYHGLLATPRRQTRWPAAVKRAWLRFEGRAVCRGGTWRLGRTILALCQRRGA